MDKHGGKGSTSNINPYAGLADVAHWQNLGLAHKHR